MKIIDLSHPFTITDKVFPGTPGMNFQRTHEYDRDGYNLSLCNINTHAGTHTDAPLHFLKEGKDLSEVPMDSYVGNCFVVNCLAKGYSNAFLEVEDVKPFEEQIKAAGKVIFATGWAKNFNTEEFFTEYPSVSIELAEYLVSLGVNMMGVEGPSVNTKDGVRVHEILLGADIAIVEGLANLEKLVSKTILFSGAPLRFVGMDGCPLRACAIVLH